MDASVPCIAELDPSFEGILATKPDFVATQFQWQIGPERVVATVEQFEDWISRSTQHRLITI